MTLDSHIIDTAIGACYGFVLAVAISLLRVK